MFWSRPLGIVSNLAITEQFRYDSWTSTQAIGSFQCSYIAPKLHIYSQPHLLRHYFPTEFSDDR